MKYLNTTGDAGLDRELQDLRSQISAMQDQASGQAPAPNSPAPFSPVKIPTALADLSDVNALAPSANDALGYSGGDWVNAPVVNSLDGRTGNIKTLYSYRFMFGG